jgi:hypothetical protein
VNIRPETKRINKLNRKKFSSECSPGSVYPGEVEVFESREVVEFGDPDLPAQPVNPGNK